MILSFAACNNYTLSDGDISAAYLQGEPLKRTVILRPPRGGIPGVPEDSFIQALVPVQNWPAVESSISLGPDDALERDAVPRSEQEGEGPPPWKLNMLNFVHFVHTGRRDP